jgi:hypothetical protein
VLERGRQGGGDGSRSAPRRNPQGRSRQGRCHLPHPPGQRPEAGPQADRDPGHRL